MKKVIFTESQFKKLIGESCYSYLGGENVDNDEPAISQFTDGGVTSDKIDGVETDSITSDEEGNEVTPGANMFRKNYQRGGLTETKKKSLDEVNNRIKDKKIKLSPFQKEKLKNALNQDPNNNIGRKCATNILNNGELTYNNANVIKNRLGNGKDSVIPNKVFNSIDNRRKNIQQTDSTIANSSVNTNTTEGLKTNKSTKHRAKDDNPVTFTYYN